MNRNWTRAADFPAFFEANPDATQHDVAEALGITQGHLSQIINGQRMPRPKLALKISGLLGVTSDALMRTRAGRVA